MLSVRNQIWMKDEKDEGTLAASMTVADALYAIGAKVQIERDEFTEDRTRRTLSRPTSLIGQSRMKFSFGLDLKGAGQSAGVPILPELDRPLRSCGMRRIQMYRAAPGVITNGPIHHGATYTQAGSGSAGFIIGEYASSAARLHYMPTNGIAMNNSGLVTVNDNPTWYPGPYTEMTFTPGSSTAHGFAYLPASEIWSLSTRAAWVGTPTTYETIRGNTSGALATLLDPVAPLGSSGSLYAQVQLGTFLPTEGITGLLSGATSALTGTGFSLIYNTSVTQQFYLDGLRFIGTGCRGNLKLPLQTKDPIQVDFEYDGLEYSVTGAAVPTGAVFDQTRPPRFVSADWSLDRYGFGISKLEIDLGNVLNQRLNPNYPEGAISFEITDRDPSVATDPEMFPPEVYDYFAKWRAATTAAAKVRLGSTEVGISTATAIGRIVWIDMPAIQYAAVPLGDRNNRVTGDIAGKLRQADANGNNEIVFYFL
jgi:hypothetical protein